MVMVGASQGGSLKLLFGGATIKPEHTQGIQHAQSLYYVLAQTADTLNRRRQQ